MSLQRTELLGQQLSVQIFNFTSRVGKKKTLTDWLDTVDGQVCPERLNRFRKSELRENRSARTLRYFGSRLGIAWELVWVHRLGAEQGLLRLG